MMHQSDVFIDIVSAGPAASYFRSLADSSETSNLWAKRISFSGLKSYHGIISSLCASHIFISLSISEPFGLMYLEALYCGCVVVGPASGGLVEIFALSPNCRNNIILVESISEHHIRNSLSMATSLIRNRSRQEATLIAKLIRDEIAAKFSSINHASQILNFLD
jgi:glycosyltransferase involved in cell wall biosynthesis